MDPAFSNDFTAFGRPISFDAQFRTAFLQVVVVVVVAGRLCETFGFPFVTRLFRAAFPANKAAAAVPINSTDAGPQTTAALQDCASSTVRNSRREPHNPDQNSRLVELRLNSDNVSMTVSGPGEGIRGVELQKTKVRSSLLCYIANLQNILAPTTNDYRGARSLRPCVFLRA